MYWNKNLSAISAISLCWIVTLDVLKSMSDLFNNAFLLCWIVTLDVLKLGIVG